MSLSFKGLEDAFNNQVNDTRIPLHFFISICICTCVVVALTPRARVSSHTAVVQFD